MDCSKFLRSGELARLAGVSPDTIRYYERKGLIPHPLRAPNGYRLYSPAVLNRIRVIRQALSIGFTIEELARVFQTRDRGGAPCHDVRELAKTKLREMELRLHEIKMVRNELRSLLKIWDARLSSVKSGEKALLLESLPSMITKGSRAMRRLGPTSKRSPQS